MNSNKLILKGGEMKTWKGDPSNVCNVKLYYTVYITGNRPGSPVFSPLDIAYLENCSGGNFPSGGPCGGNDQKWRKIDYSIDLTAMAIGNYTLEIYWQEEGNANSNSNCGEFKYDNNGGSSTNYTASFTITEILPVTYEYFKASRDEEHVVLDWKTAIEIDNNYFEIEKSTNGLHFSYLDKVNANENGRSAIYQYFDKIGNHSSELYYRLKQIDYNGNFSYSEIVSINGDRRYKPVLKRIDKSNYLLTLDEFYTVNVFDTNGRVLFSQNFNEGESALNFNFLNNGLYILHFNGKSQVYSEKLWINN
jgi:hypothetical protein